MVSCRLRTPIHSRLGDGSEQRFQSDRQSNQSKMVMVKKWSSVLKHKKKGKKGAPHGQVNQDRFIEDKIAYNIKRWSQKNKYKKAMWEAVWPALPASNITFLYLYFWVPYCHIFIHLFKNSSFYFLMYHELNDPIFGLGNGESSWLPYFWDCLLGVRTFKDH